MIKIQRPMTAVWIVGAVANIHIPVTVVPKIIVGIIMSIRFVGDI